MWYNIAVGYYSNERWSLSKKNKKNVLGIIQWTFAGLGMLMSCGAFSQGGTGILSGILILISAFAVSPLLELTNILKGKKTLGVFLQFVVAFLLFIIGIGFIPSNNKDSSSETNSAINEISTTSQSQKTKGLNSEVSSETSKSVPHRTDNTIIGISDKSLSSDNIDVMFSDEVRNDVTGNWKLSRIAASIDFNKYALDYYKNYFKDNNEVHVIVNFTYKTTTIVTYMSGILDVTVHEYVDKEEHDAKLIGDGMVLGEYFIYVDNGDIEKVS